MFDILVQSVLIAERRCKNWNKLMDDRMLMREKILPILIALDSSSDMIDSTFDAEEDNTYEKYIDKLKSKNEYTWKEKDMALIVLELTSVGDDKEI